jgi:hypothetical protein
VSHWVHGRIAVSLVVCLVVGCAARQKMASSAMPSAAPMQASQMPPPLDHSVFSRDPGGQLTEEALQKILASPIELDLPSRVGVLPIITATDWRGPSPDFERVPPGLGSLVGRLRKDAALRDLPRPLRPGQRRGRGRPRKYGKK